MFAVSSRCKNDSQLCFKCLHCLNSQITVLVQWYHLTGICQQNRTAKLQHKKHERHVDNK